MVNLSIAFIEFSFHTLLALAIYMLGYDAGKFILSKTKYGNILTGNPLMRTMDELLDDIVENQPLKTVKKFPLWVLIPIIAFTLLLLFWGKVLEVLLITYLFIIIIGKITGFLHRIDRKSTGAV